MKGKSNTFGQRQVRGYMTLNHSFLKQNREENSSIAGLAQETKRMTYCHKSNTCEISSQTMKSFQIQDRDLTSKEKDLTPYWTMSCREMSQKLLSLTKTDYVGLDSPFLNRLQPKTLAKSWFSMKLNSLLSPSLFKIYFPLSTFSHVGFTDSEDTVVRSRKIRIYPKNNQLFIKYMGLTRYWYNKTVEYLKKDGIKAYLPEVRKVIFIKENHEEWAFDCPQRIREHAISDAISAVKNAKKKFKKDGFQDVGFRSRKDVTQRFGFDKVSLSNSYVFGNKKNKGEFYATEPILTELEGTEIIKENGRFYLIIPSKIAIKTPDNQRFDCVSLDPGIRTFQTIFSPQVQGKIGNSDFNRIYRLCICMDGLISKRSSVGCKARKNIKKAIERMRWKIKDLIDELHKKTASFLVTNFDNILIPTFETSKMVTKLRSKTARNMLTFAHYRFKMFLKCKAEEYSCKVHEVNEAYTSKTCSYCGKISNIGSKKIMNCSCGVKEDRDINGARGIFLRALAVTPVFIKNAIVNES